MKILFFCPSLKIRSEWMFRLIENFQEEIGCIVTNEPNIDRVILPQKSINPIQAKILRKIEEQLNVFYTYPYILNNLEKKYNTSVNYIHFLGFARNFKEFIINSSNPTIIHCHGKDIMWDLKDFSNGKYLHDALYFKFLDDIKDKVYFIANSHFTKNQLLDKGVPEKRIFINHFGIKQNDNFNPKSSKIFRILYLGRLVDFKGPLETIEAFNIASAAGMNAELIIAGRGEMEEKCRVLIDKSPFKSQIVLKGWVDNNGAELLYSSCDLFTAHNKIDDYTNQVEAFGVTIIEAMSHGLPVITGKCGGVEDSIINGETGYLVEPGNIEEHAEKFLKLYKDISLRKKLGENAQKRARDHFSFTKEKQGLQYILNEINK